MSENTEWLDEVPEEILQTPVKPAEYDLDLWLSTDGKHSVQVHVTKPEYRAAAVAAAKNLYEQIVNTYGMKPAYNKTVGGQANKTAASSQAPICPIHGTEAQWKTGTSQKTGKAYAFWSCPTKNHDGSFCNAKLPAS